LTKAVYLAHLNPVTKAHVEIIKDLQKKSERVVVMPVIFLKNGKEVNSRSFPFDFNLRKKMLETVFGDSITISKNYTFNAPFSRYLPPLLSPSSWKLRRQLSKGLNHDYFTYTGDKAERLMLKVYGLHPRIGSRKEISASSVKTKLFNAAKGKNSTWEEDVLPEVAKIIKENWDVVEKFAKIKDETKRVAGMKFPRDGYWSK